MHHLLSARSAVVASLALVLSACESGGEPESTAIAVSAHSIEFSAQSPDDPAPEAQEVTATFGDAVVHLAVVHTGDAIGEVTTSMGEGTAQIAIEPNEPSSIGAGTFSGAVAITGYSCADETCSALAPGDSQTVAVSYQISPIVRYVAPYVATAGTSSTAIVRGGGFSTFTVEDVTFGTTSATSFTVAGDSEIHVTYPALPAGNYDVQIDAPDHEGAIISTATLTVVEPTAYAAATLAYPTADPEIRTLVYDAERSALLVATDANGGSILRYAYAGGTWGAPLSAAVDQLQDIALSIDGAQLLALSRTELIPVEPASLGAGTAVTAPSLEEDAFLKGLALINDNRAIVTSGIDAAELTTVYSYNVRTGAMGEAAAGFTLNNATPSSSANASRTVLIQGHPSQDSDPAVYSYATSNNTFAASGVSLRQNEIEPALGRAATRIVLNGTRVYSANFVFLGTLPESTAAVVVSPDGERAYTYDSEAAAVLTFDITEAADNEDEEDDSLPQVGSATALAGDPGASVRMAISPDGGTLFLAGSTQLVIQPTP